MEESVENSVLRRPGPTSSLSLPTLVVVEFHQKAQKQTIDWLIGKIRAKRSKGGAELIVKILPAHNDKGVMLHVSAPTVRLLEAAELLEIKKKDHEGYLRELTLRDIEPFLYDGITMESLLSMAEKQRIVLHELQNIRAQTEDHVLPGYPQIQLYNGQPIFVLCQVEEIITQAFPLHDTEELHSLGVRWYWAILSEQPLEDIRTYFGEAIAIYFAFLGFYTIALIIPAIVGITQFFLTFTDKYEFTVFAFFNLVWVTLFLEAWKRHCNELAYKWGTMHTESLKEARPSYYGEMKLSPVTGRYEPTYPPWKTMAKTYGMSFPIVFLCLVLAFIIMLISFWAEDYMTDIHRRYGNSITSLLTYLPSVIYAAIVWLMGGLYNKLSTFLTEWENHRTQTEFDNHRIVKLVLFEFVNNFMSLFYIAFYIQDLQMLQSQVAVMLIIQQAISHFQEALLPFVILQWYTKWHSDISNKMQKKKRAKKAIYTTVGSSASDSDQVANLETTEAEELDIDDTQVQKAISESKMDPYEGTYDDYLEMFIQFGYVFLFSSVFPLAAFWAVFNNVLEIRADAFKLCKAFQRPTAKQAKNIGAWQIAFELMGAIAVMTNCALLALSPDLRTHFSRFSSVEWTLLFVAIEHIILFLKVIIAYLIPDVPHWIDVALAKTDYESTKALRNERSQKTRRHLQRLKTVGHLDRCAQESDESNLTRRDVTRTKDQSSDM